MCKQIKVADFMLHRILSQFIRQLGNLAMRRSHSTGSRLLDWREEVKPEGRAAGTWVCALKRVL